MVRWVLGSGPPIMALVIAACALVDDPGDMTCAEWLVLGRDDRVVVAAELTGDSADRLARIRSVQRLPPGTGRQAVVDAVASSLDKNCELLRSRNPHLREVMAALY
jgi:hypothetical protein